MNKSEYHTLRASQDDVDSLEKINSMFDSLLVKAGESYKAENENGQKNNTQEGVKYSLNSNFSQEVQEWFDTTSAEERKKAVKDFW